jgi:hypothetical protein
VIRALLILCLLLLSGCTLPEWRVGQQKVDGRLAEKPPQQIEAERRAAKYLSLRSLVLEPDAAQQLLDIHRVATPLSASLGEPAAPVTIEDQAAVIDALKKGILAEQAKTEAWKAFARKHAGKPIEGTGVDLAPWGGGLGVIALVAACVFIPGFGSLVLFVIKRLRGTVQQMAQSVEEYAIEHPARAEELKEYFSSAMDRPAKAIVKREKQYLDESNLQELRQKAALAAAAATHATT